MNNNFIFIFHSVYDIGDMNDMGDTTHRSDMNDMNDTTSQGDMNDMNDMGLKRYIRTYVSTFTPYNNNIYSMSCRSCRIQTPI